MRLNSLFLCITHKSLKERMIKLFWLTRTGIGNAHFYAKNDLKHHYDNLIKQQLQDNNIKFEEYQVEYTYFYKSKVSDLMNVVALQSKFLNDTLQELGIVKNDNVKYCKKETAIVGSHDKEDPRVEITIKEYKT